MMNDNLDNLVGIIAILSAVALPIALGMYIAIRSMSQKHKERMEMIKQGLMPPENEKETRGRAKVLKNAIFFLGIGLGLGVGLLIVRFMHIDQDDAFWIVGPSILLFLGISYLVYFFLSKKLLEKEGE